MAQYLKTLIVIFDTRLVVVAIQVRIGLDESRQSFNVRNDPFQSLFKIVSTPGNFHALSPTAKVQFLIPCCWTGGVGIDGGPICCFDGVLEETKTVAGVDAVEDVGGSQVCAPELDPATDGMGAGG